MEYTEATLIGTKAFHWFMVFLPTTGLNYQHRGGGGDGGEEVVKRINRKIEEKPNSKEEPCTITAIPSSEKGRKEKAKEERH